MDEWAHDEDLYDVSYSEMVCDCVNHTLNYLCLLKRLDFLLVFVLATCLFLLNFPIFQYVLLMLDMIPHANMQMVELTRSRALCSIFSVLETMPELIQQCSCYMNNPRTKHCPFLR